MAPWRARACLAGAALAAVLAGAAPAGRAVVGGGAIRIQSAPWSVFVEYETATASFLCSGSILDASQILTAAHCLFDATGARATPAQLNVEAGVSNEATPLASDDEQERTVGAFRIHPGYVWSPRSSPDDVAVLELGHPLALGGGSAQAVALPRAGAPFPAGARVGLAGFGRERAARAASGALEWLNATVDPQGSCGAPGGTIDDDAVAFCAASPSAATCNGDSGSGLVTTGATPTLVGVVSGGPAGCAPASQTLYTYIDAPEILSFLRGSDDPPRAPRVRAGTFLDLTWQPPLVVGTTLDCSSGGWGGPVGLRFSFATTSGRVLESGARTTYLLGPEELGARVLCEVAATNAGGTAVAETTPSTAVRPPPPLTIARLPALHAVAGNELLVRVVLHAPQGLEGTFGACVVPPAAVGHRDCSSLRGQHGGAGWFTYVLSFRVLPSAPPGSVALAVEAFAGAGRARATLRLRVEPRGAQEVASGR